MINHSSFNFSINCNQLSQTTNRSMLIEGVCSLSFGPAKQHEWNLFTCINSRTIEHIFSLTSRRMISTALSKLRAIRDHARVLASPQHGGLWHNVCYAKIVALQLANYQRLCLNVRFMRRSAFYCASHVLRDTVLTFRLNLSRSTRYSYNYSALPHGSG